MRESRRVPRLSAKQRGTAIISGRAAIECIIRDLSSTGARLSFSHPTILPRAFRLQFEDHDERVSVIWQGGLFAGVKFQTPMRALPPQKKRAWPWSRK